MFGKWHYRGLNRQKYSPQHSPQHSPQPPKCPFFQQNEMYNFRGRVKISSGFQRLFKERLNTGLFCPFFADFAPSGASR
nr:MAG TPA: hypothetical protein [Caudoviricetes sp.]